MRYIHKNLSVSIEIRQQNTHKIAWALFVDGKYQKTKVLPRNNTAIPQNFGYSLADFETA